MHISCTFCFKRPIIVHLDEFDRKLLRLLQADGRLTNNELSQKINLSASQCSRRRTRLEQEGYIRGYRADLDREKLGIGIVNLITVTLATHNRDNAQRFARLIGALPEVLEAYSLTGEMDYIIKVVTPDLRSLSAFVSDVLLPHESVQHVKTAIVLDTLKEGGGLPV
ncbi:Lrp/AsnC family transcriptional regulator [Hoeflea sp. AS60]|uniref:Lrp/AsnC family transcriptional regulator n=1 Tax=Hoeflea sp. AS60 TaxID=3135780 RepID=UPI00317F9087